MELWIEPWAVIAFLILLAASIFMLINFYVCDSQNCKAFNEAAKVAPKGTKAYTIALLQEFFNDGIWPLPFIGGAIAAPLILWFVRIPITILNFITVFLVTFIVIYFMFAFFGHHYINFIAAYVISFIEANCPSAVTAGDLPATDPQVTTQTDLKEEELNKGLDEEEDDDFGITFAPPVEVF
jgi:hypothetical protein